MLPDGMLLVNPAYFCRTEPVNGAAAVPGQTGYMVAINAQHQPTGYLITGYGMQDEIVQIYKDPDGLPADGHHESGQRVDPAMDSGVE
jgi:hypothetical protein